MSYRTRIALALLCTLATGLPAAAQQQPRMKVVLDTDIGTDIDDAWALGYALKSPSFELLGVTVTRRRHAGARAARVQAAVSARPHGCAGRGRTADAGGPCRSHRLPVHVGGGLSRPTSRSPRRPSSSSPTRFAGTPAQITLIAVGPLQNIGDLVRLHPDVVPLVKRVVLMSGSIGAELRGARRRSPSGTSSSRSPRRRRSTPPLAGDDRAARLDHLHPARGSGARDAAQGGHAAGHRARGAAAAVERSSGQPHDAARSDGARRGAASRAVLRPLRRRCRIRVDAEGYTRVDTAAGRPVSVCLEPKRDEFMTHYLAQLAAK